MFILKILLRYCQPLFFFLLVCQPSALAAPASNHIASKTSSSFKRKQAIDEARSYYELGFSYAAAGSFGKSSSAYRHAASLLIANSHTVESTQTLFVDDEAPSLADCFLRLGCIDLLEQKYLEAENNFASAQKLLSSNVCDQSILISCNATAYCFQGDLEKFKTEFDFLQRILRQRPKGIYPSLFATDLATVAARARDFFSFEKLARFAMESEQKVIGRVSSHRLLSIANLYATYFKNYDRAMELAQVAAFQDSNSSVFELARDFNYLATLCKMKGERIRSQEYSENAHRLLPNGPFPRLGDFIEVVPGIVTRMETGPRQL